MNSCPESVAYERIKASRQPDRMSIVLTSSSHILQVHVTLGHTTLMAEAQYFGLPDSSSQNPAAALASTVARIGQLALNVSHSTVPTMQHS